MVAGEHIKSAASSMHRAASAMQQQVKDLQARLVRLRSDKKALIDKDSIALKTSQAELSSVGDDRRRSRLSQQIQALQDEIVAAENELKQAEADMQQAIDDKLRTVADLENQARDLDVKAARTE